MPLIYDCFPSHVIAFTSDRTVDFTLKKDQTGLTKAQKKYLFSQWNEDFPEPVRIRQVHGDDIICADKGWKSGFQDADGALTQEALLPLAVRTADCLPVFFYDARQDGIGLVHAGWRGAQKNIMGRAVALMMRQWGTEPRNIMVALGPAIRPCCYEVGEEFCGYFPQEVSARDGRHFLDLPQVARGQLTALDVPEGNIHDCGICTGCTEDYFSYRREGSKAGRMISLMVLKPKGGK